LDLVEHLELILHLTDLLQFLLLNLQEEEEQDIIILPVDLVDLVEEEIQQDLEILRQHHHHKEMPVLLLDLKAVVQVVEQEELDLV
jgi:hypothetical protein